MAPLSLLAAASITALFGWGFVSKLFHRQPVTKSVIEQEMKKEGTMQANGTIKVDAEFDAELNALLKEMGAANADANAQIDAFGKAE